MILGLPWYGRAWSTDVRRRPRVRPRAAPSTATARPSTTRTSTDLVREARAPLGPRGAEPVRRLPPPELHQHLRLRDQLAPGLLRRRRLAEAAAGAWSTSTACGVPACGPWATTAATRSCTAPFAESFLVDKSAPQAGIELLSTAQADEGFVVSWAAKDVSSVVSYDVQVSVNGGAWTTWLSGTKATSDVWLGRDGTGYAFRVRARDSKGNTGAFNATSTWDPTPALAVGGFGRVVTDGLSYRTGPDTSAARLGSLDAGTIVAVTRGPVSQDGYTLVRGHPADQGVEPGHVRGAGRLGRRRVVRHDPRQPRTARPTAPAWTPGSSAWTSGRDGSALGTTAAARGVALLLAGRRRLRGRPPAPLDQRPSRWTASCSRSTGRTGRSRAPAGCRISPRAPGPSTGTARSAAAGSRTAATSSSWWARPDGRTYSAPSARPGHRRRRSHGTPSRSTPCRPRSPRPRRRTTLISPNGDGVLDRTRLVLTATGATRWSARVTNGAGTVVRSASGHGRHGGPDLGGHRRRRRAGARRALRGGAGRVRRRRQPRRAHLGRDRGHGGTRRGAQGDTVHLLAERRRRRRHDGPLVVGQREGDGHGADLQGHDARPLLDDHVALHAGPRHGTAGRRPGHARERRQIHLQGLAQGRGRQPPLRVRPRSSWTAPPGACAGRAASSRRTATPCGRPRP